MRCFSLLIIALVFAPGCSRGGSPTSHETPAKVEHPKTEAELTTVKLTPDAVRRLAIETATVKAASAAMTRTWGGEIVIPEGKDMIVTAPIAGTLTGGAPPAAGARVRRGDRLMTIAPIAAAERDQRIDAQRTVATAEAEELAARQRLQRLEQLLKDGAASVRSVEEARAQHTVAVATLTAARDRLGALSRNPVAARGEIVVTAPFDGVVQKVSAALGQTVAASSPLIELAQVDTLWVRVPIYAGDLGTIEQNQPITVKRLGDLEAPMAATRVTAPLRGDATAASVDLTYVIQQRRGTLRPGERVLVEVPLTTMETGLVVPEASVLYDMHGTAWVYEDLGGHAYARRRIEIARHVGDRAVVGRGLREGMKVVTAGAAELFGTEFGAGH